MLGFCLSCCQGFPLFLAQCGRLEKEKILLMKAAGLGHCHHGGETRPGMASLLVQLQRDWKASTRKGQPEMGGHALCTVKVLLMASLSGEV